MFICQQCEKPIGPGVSPIVVVTEVRDKTYSNQHRDVETEAISTVVTTGREIVHEIRICRACAGLPPAIRLVNADLSAAVGMIRSLHLHAKGCKKPLADCKICQHNIEVIGTVSIKALGFALTG